MHYIVKLVFLQNYSQNFKINLKIVVIYLENVWGCNLNFLKSRMVRIWLEYALSVNS